MNEPTEQILSAVLNVKQYKVKLFDLQHRDSPSGQEVVYLFKATAGWKDFSFNYVLTKEQAQLVDWDYISAKVGYEVWGVIF